MTPVTWQPEVCPTCGNILPGLGTFCHMCHAYTEDMGATTDVSPAARERIPDDRTEAQVQLAIRRAAELLGYEAFDLSQGRPTRQPAGIPDLYVRGHGRRVWIEVKRPHGGKLSEAQHQFITGELGNGGDAFVARSEDDFLLWHTREGA
jgi:hypothetical protein